MGRYDYFPDNASSGSVQAAYRGVRIYLRRLRQPGQDPGLIDLRGDLRHRFGLGERISAAFSYTFSANCTVQCERLATGCARIIQYEWMLVFESTQLWKLASLIEGGGTVLPQFDGAGPIVSTNVAPSLICA
jgi:hypothetical protein